MAYPLPVRQLLLRYVDIAKQLQLFQYSLVFAGVHHNGRASSLLGKHQRPLGSPDTPDQRLRVRLKFRDWFGVTLRRHCSHARSINESGSPISGKTAES